MSQFDFSRVFPASPTNPAKTDPRPLAFLTRDDAPQRYLNRAHWANIAFVAGASLGAFICAFYFFGADEFLRAAATWPREILYPRPTPPERSLRSGLTENGREQSFPEKYRPVSDDSGDPFRRAVTSLDLNRSPFRNYLIESHPNLSSPVGAPNPVPILSQLNAPVPGGDTLAKALNHGAADLAQAKALENAQRNALRSQPAVPQVRFGSARARKATGRTKNVRSSAMSKGTQQAKHGVGNLSASSTLNNAAPAAAAGAQAQSVGRTASSNVRPTPVQTQLSTTRSATNVQQQLRTFTGTGNIGGHSSIPASLPGGKH